MSRRTESRIVKTLSVPSVSTASEQGNVLAAFCGETRRITRQKSAEAIVAQRRVIRRTW